MVSSVEPTSSGKDRRNNNPAREACPRASGLMYHFGDWDAASNHVNLQHFSLTLTSFVDTKIWGSAIPISKWRAACSIVVVMDS
jgi:hypothetical protein